MTWLVTWWHISSFGCDLPPNNRNRFCVNRSCTSSRRIVLPTRIFASRPSARTELMQMSHRTNRRRFIHATAGSSIGVFASGYLSSHAQQGPGTDAGTHKPVLGSLPLAESRGAATKFWIDPTIAAWRPGPWRKVHIEFHNSRHVPKLGERFNAEEFGDRLLEAHITGATVFAKDMYGYCYYPSSLGPIHPKSTSAQANSSSSCRRTRRKPR